MFASEDEATSLAALNSVDWRENPELAIALQDSVAHSEVTGICSTIRVCRNHCL